MKKFNWPIWFGFMLSLFALFSYPFLFVRWATTRDFPWVNFPLFAVALLLLFIGIRRAFSPGRRWISKTISSVVFLLGVLSFGMFLFAAFVAARWLPPSAGAPQVGQKAPEFTLSDTNNKPVSLAELLAQPLNGKPARGALVIFYRGYW